MDGLCGGDRLTHLSKTYYDQLITSCVEIWLRRSVEQGSETKAGMRALVLKVDTFFYLSAHSCLHRQSVRIDLPYLYTEYL